VALISHSIGTHDMRQFCCSARAHEPLYPKGHNKSEIAPYALFEFCRRFPF
jgi:hypothetical protein